MLRIYSFILDTLRKMAPLVRDIAKHDPDLARQLRRSASSIALMSVSTLMGPPAAKIASHMGPPDRQGHGTTREAA